MAIQACIDKCSAGGGGTVVIPKGVFINGSIFLKKGVSLFIEKDGKLKGSTESADYPQVATRWEGIERIWIAALVNAIDLQNIEISGKGTIDGSGEVWTQRGVQFKNCNIKAQKGFVIQYANNVDLSGLTITCVTGEAVIRKSVKDN